MKFEIRCSPLDRISRSSGGSRVVGR